MATGSTISIEILKRRVERWETLGFQRFIWFHFNHALRNKCQRALDVPVHEGAITAFLLDHDVTTHAKFLRYTTKQKSKEKAGKWELGPISKAKEWKIMVAKATWMGPGFTRKTTKYERFIRPMGLWFLRANVIHPELKCTFNLDIIGMKENPNLPMYSHHRDKGESDCAWLFHTEEKLSGGGTYCSSRAV
ncbi:hypothetical protein COCNU_15G001240 [Cocos nucifera]|uniref:Uncharacterized protein n=1 Tax=Cocos nucifera TaxID=13894 RepID=A0A8K0NDU9_COCNU|nr:hypothetical protein COCNU_15G001240 [Cocos nucifera]